MIVETLGLAALAMSSLSDADRRRHRILAKLGRWDQLYANIGPKAYASFVKKLEDTVAFHDAVEPLMRHATNIAVRKFGTDDIQFGEEDGVSLASDGVWIAGSIWMSDSEYGEEPVENLPRILAEHYEDDPEIEIHEDADTHSAGQEGVWVTAWFRVSSEELEQHKDLANASIMTL
jgi:hypothetical protein